MRGYKTFFRPAAGFFQYRLQYDMNFFTAEIPEIRHMHAYNYGHDTRRVSALMALLKAHPERACLASGKSAYLAGIAGAIIGKENVRLENPEKTDVDIPGIELLRNMPLSSAIKVL